MKKLKEIKLSEIQLDSLLDEKRKEDYRFLLDKGVYCTKCNTICKNGVEVRTVKLNHLNDIIMEGTCKKCGQNVARVMEFGEDREFFQKAMFFREVKRK